MSDAVFQPPEGEGGVKVSAVTCQRRRRPRAARAKDSGGTCLWENVSCDAWQLVGGANQSRAPARISHSAPALTASRLPWLPGQR